MNENIKQRILVTFSIDNEIIKEFKIKAKGENRKYSSLIEMFIKDYIKPHINTPIIIEEKKGIFE
jgi:hypothetical protein